MKNPFSYFFFFRFCENICNFWTRTYVFTHEYICFFISFHFFFLIFCEKLKSKAGVAHVLIRIVGCNIKLKLKTKLKAKRKENPEVLLMLLLLPTIQRNFKSIYILVRVCMYVQMFKCMWFLKESSKRTCKVLFVYMYVTLLLNSCM